jgi:hypothetical protein
MTGIIVRFARPIQLLHSLLTTMIDTLMSAEADAVCGAWDE